MAVFSRGTGVSSVQEATKQAGVDRSWTGQDAWGVGLRFMLAVLPSLAALIAVIITLRLTPDADTWLGALGWIALAAVVGFTVAFVTSRFTVRALPLAALLRLSLVFPDQAPSRLKLAIRAASPKRLKAEVESARHHGLSSDATEAAGQVLLLTAALGEHDRRTRGHSERVRLFSRLLGEEMGLRGIDLERLQWGALLHDIGKLTIPTEILNKPDKLDDVEWAIMAGHAAASRDLVAPLAPFLGSFVSAADGHHEKWDGSGYPLGIRGSAIPLPARIVAVADAYEVMTATRAYKKPMSAEAARAELTSCAGSHFDPDVVRAWLNVSVGAVNKATGPAAFVAGLPLIGELLAVAGRTATQIAALPAAVASAAPAAATAGAMTVAAVAGPSIAAPREPDLALDLVPTITTPVNTIDLFATSSTIVVTTAPPTTEASTTEASTTTIEVSTTVIAVVVSSTTTAPPTTTTTVAPTTTTTAPTTTTTAPPETTATTAPPTTTATAPPETTTTTAPLTETVFASATIDPIIVSGPTPTGVNLDPTGPYAGGTYLFRDPAQTLTEDLVISDITIPAGTTVCSHLFITHAFDNNPRWQLNFNAPILSAAWSTEELVTSDFFSPSADFGDMNLRGLENDDRLQVSNGGLRLTLDLNGNVTDSVRIFIDCSS